MSEIENTPAPDAITEIENAPAIEAMPQMEKPEIPLGYRRADGTAVGLVDGNPYHFTPESRYWDDVKDRIAELPLQIALADGRMQPEYINGELVTKLPAPPKPTSADVNAEMQRRVTLGFIFNGKQFDYTMEAKTNISGAAQMAFMAIVANPAAAKSLHWNGEPEEFQWCTYDNTFMPMTGEMVIAFGQTAAGHEHAHKKAVWKLKDMPEIPEDFKDDKYWPTLDTRL